VGGEIFVDCAISRYQAILIRDAEPHENGHIILVTRF